MIPRWLQQGYPSSLFRRRPELKNLLKGYTPE